ncbi:MAG: [FeFe] hydrogenase H-cluster radical SAM maturase HydE [Candidatus Omnitrophica bacterium]|nr:[FeFe] hydrogenase H-cluster radical SAM maturase HydE [Candidatus Omnitrophota bacterium]
MMNKQEMIDILSSLEPKAMNSIFKRAYALKLKYVGNTVYFRGIIEFSNLCSNDCYYCGIRSSNDRVRRFTMTEQEILAAARFADQAGYASLVLQAGERDDPEFIDFIEGLIIGIKNESSNRLGITLSLGEQRYETFSRWFKAGAHRYLLRIETSNPDLYKKLHPRNQDYYSRRDCLNNLKNIGYQVGTGVMIGLPFQTAADLVEDIIFFKKQDIDMIGMGPYIGHHATPLYKVEQPDNQRNFLLSLAMIALTRINLLDVNIAATTALQALDDYGREKGIKAGANIIMPNITPLQYRDGYQLYDNKPCLDENADQCQACLTKRIIAIGEQVGFNQWGDSPHFLSRVK